MKHWKLSLGHDQCLLYMSGMPFLWEYQKLMGFEDIGLRWKLLSKRNVNSEV